MARGGTGAVLGTRTIVDPGNNGFQVDRIGIGKVRSLVFVLPGSGSINDIVFCRAMQANTTLVGTWTRVCDWGITKTLLPSSHDLFVGETATSTVVTNVTKTCAETRSVCTRTEGASSVSSQSGSSLTRVRGGVDPDPNRADGFADPFVVDVGTQCRCTTRRSTGEYVRGACPALPFLLFVGCVPGSSAVCSVDCEVCRNVSTSAPLTATFIFESPSAADVFWTRATGSAPASPALVDSTATVSDSEGAFPLFVTSVPAVRTAAKNFTCGALGQPPSSGVCTSRAVEGTTLAERAASAPYALTCRDPAVTKTASAHYTRAYSWAIEKTGSSARAVTPPPGPDCTLLSVPEGAPAAGVEYSVTITASAADSGVLVNGTVTVTNPHPTRALSLAGLTDSAALDDGSTVSVALSCPATLVGALSSATCTYSAPTGATVGGTNTAALSLNGFTISGSAAFAFGAPDSSTGATATVTDVFGPASTSAALGTYTSVTGSETFVAVYSKEFGAGECAGRPSGEVVRSRFDNTATVAWEGGSASDSWAVKVETTCSGDECPCEFFPWPPANINEDYCISASSPNPTAGAAICWTQ